ncbi:MAG: hypothetical protein ACD_39C00687G0001 [uncultured bacterium]|nr:MAG: hypothetical protein ACD_39C00687G0001 [uncultured bacterium]
MKKNIFLAGLFMSCFAIGLAVLALYFVFDSTRTEVVALNNQLRDLDTQIDELRTLQAKHPEDQKTAKAFARLNMDRVLLPQPWFLQMELAEKGLFSFIVSVFGSAETRRANLRKIVLERAQNTKMDGCPAEFQRLFKIYASEEGYGSESLQALRNFASSYEEADNSSTKLPDSKPAVASESSELSDFSVSSETSELPELSGPTEPVGPPGGVIQTQ